MTKETVILLIFVWIYCSRTDKVLGLINVYSELDDIYPETELIYTDHMFHCMLKAMSSSGAHIVCGQQPSPEDVTRTLYYSLCRPSFMWEIKINCYYNQYNRDYFMPYTESVYNKVPVCWCAYIHFDWKLIKKGIFSGIKVINEICLLEIDEKMVSPKHLFSLELFGIKTKVTNYRFLDGISELIVSKTELEIPSLFDLNKITSLKTLSLRSHNFTDIFEIWQNESHHMNYTIVHLYELELTDCNIRSIPSGIFHKITVDNQLSLAYNSIDIISRTTFIGLTSLINLVLRANNISMIHRLAFRHMTSLKQIDLSYNNIHNLDSNIFLSMNSHWKLVVTNYDNVTREQLLKQLTLSVPRSQFIFIEDTTVPFKIIQEMNGKWFAEPTQTVALDADYIYEDEYIYGYNWKGQVDVDIDIRENPIDWTTQGCFNVRTTHIAIDVKESNICLCNISDIQNNTEEADITECKMANTSHKLAVTLNDSGLTTLIGVLSNYTCQTNVPVNIYLDFNSIEVIPSSNEWLPALCTLDLLHTDMEEKLKIIGFSLSYNKITTISQNAWKYLFIQSLDMSHNQLKWISGTTFQFLQAKEIILSYNQIEVIESGAFVHISDLQGLYINDNNLHRLLPWTLPSQLVQLSIQNNFIHDLSFANQSLYISCLSISNNSIHNVSSFIPNLTQLNELHINQNQIKIIDEKTFQTCKNIEYIDLSNNYLTQCCDSYNFRGITNLKYLNLSSNWISSIEFLFQYKVLSHLEYLYLSNNNISRIYFINTKQANGFLLKYLYLSDNIIEHVNMSSFGMLQKLLYVDLKGNRIQSLLPTNTVLPPGAVFDLRKNPLQCSCDMLWLRLRQQNAFTNEIRVDYCWNTISQEYAPVVHVPVEEFVCETPCVTKQCKCHGSEKANVSAVTHVTCTKQKLQQVPTELPPLVMYINLSYNLISKLSKSFKDKIYIEHLNLSNNLIKELIPEVFSDIQSLTWLSLDHNLLTRLSSDILQNLNNLQTLFLNDNHIKMIEIWHFPSALQEVYLHNNMLPSIPVTPTCNDLIWLRLSQLTLRGNPFDCQSCDTFSLRACVEIHEFYLKDISDLYDWYCVTADEKYFKFLVFDNDRCFYDSGKHVYPSYHAVIIFFAIFSLTFMISLFPCAVICIRNSKYRRALRQHVHLKSRRDMCKEEKYDAWIVYDSNSREVRHWVVQVLLLTLEHEYGYRVYIEERDGPVGMHIAEANHAAIENSMRSIIVLSENLLNDLWKLDAVSQAYLCWKYTRNHNIIVVKYGDVDPDVLVGTELYALWKLGLVLDRHRRDFFKCLVAKLPRNPIR